MKNKKTALINIMAAALVLTLAGCSKPKAAADFGQIKDICELATKECYFHNVGKVNKKGEGIPGWFSIGNKKVWMEYTTQVELGIDASKVSVTAPDANNVVKVTIPNAKIIKIYTDPNTFRDPLIETGFLTTVTAEEKAAIFNETQAETEEAINTNTELLDEAKERAKTLIKRYIINVGQQLGETYTVEWIDA
jgi:5,10-methenyltetrahydromethanopterin hydrogenase